MTVLFADTSTPVEPAVLLAQGFSGVIRYLSRRAWKVPTSEELAGYHKAGLNVGLVFEDAAHQALGGGGFSDGVFSRTQAHSIGYPKGCVVFASVDFDVKTDQLPVVRNYLTAFGDGLGAGAYSAGVYGSKLVVANAPSSTPWRWETVAWSAGTPMGVVAHPDVIQDLFHPEWDTDRVYASVPWWRPTAGESAGTPTGPPAKREEVNDMWLAQGVGEPGVWLVTGPGRVHVDAGSLHALEARFGSIVQVSPAFVAAIPVLAP